MCWWYINLQEPGHKPQDKLRITNKEEEIKANGLSRKHSHFLVCVCACVCVCTDRRAWWKPPVIMPLLQGFIAEVMPAKSRPDIACITLGGLKQTTGMVPWKSPRHGPLSSVLILSIKKKSLLGTGEGRFLENASSSTWWHNSINNYEIQ
jgi:hypothetical protein